MQTDTQTHLPDAKPSRSRLVPAGLVHLAILWAVCFALYARSLFNGFVTDDNTEILQDPLIRSFRNIPRLLHTGVWFFADVKVDNYYRPLKLIVYMVEYHLFGFHPFFWHLAAILFQIAAVSAAYFLVRELAGSRLAFWSALLFAFYPLHVEAVAWISGNSGVLCGLMLMLALLLYHRARSGRSPLLHYSLSTLSFFAALLFKETAITFPAVVFAYDFLYRGERLGEIARHWRRYVDYVVALGVYLIIRITALKGFAPGVTGIRITPAQMIWAVPVLAVKYIWLSLLPTYLSYWRAFYPVRSFGWESALAIALCLSLIWATFWLRKRQSTLSLAMAWFGLTLVPAFDIPRISGSVFAERYLYVPSLGFCILAAWGWLWLRDRASRRATRGLAYAGLFVVCALYATLLVAYLPSWADTHSLLVHSAKVSPRSGRLQANMSVYFQHHGDPQKAVYYGRRAVTDNPFNPYFRNSLGRALLLAGRYGDAVPQIQQAIDIEPHYEAFWVNLAAAYTSSHKPEMAVKACRKGLLYYHDDPALLDLLGLALMSSGHSAQAIAAWHRSLQLAPNHFETHVNLATALAHVGQTQAAIGQFDAALKLEPSGPYAFLVHYKLGVLDERESDWQAAAGEFRSALKFRPDFQQAGIRLRAVQKHLGSGTIQKHMENTR